MGAALLLFWWIPRNQKLNELVEELIRIGRKIPPDSDSASHFLRQAKPRTREIGEELHRLGGTDMMRKAYAKVRGRLGGIAARELDSAWFGIGKWGRLI